MEMSLDDEQRRELEEELNLIRERESIEKSDTFEDHSLIFDASQLDGLDHDEVQSFELSLDGASENVQPNAQVVPDQSRAFNGKLSRKPAPLTPNLEPERKRLWPRTQNIDVAELPISPLVRSERVSCFGFSEEACF